MTTTNQTTPCLRTAYARQLGLWILRCLEQSDARSRLFRNLGYADDDVAEFLGLPMGSGKPDREAVESLIDQLHRDLDTTRQPIGLPPRLVRNLARFADSLDIGDVERQVLTFFIVMQVAPILTDAWDVLGSLQQRASGRILSRVLGIKRSEVERVLAPESMLRRCKLIDCETSRGGKRFTFCSERISSHLLLDRYDPALVLGEFRIQPSPRATLCLKRYPHLAEPLELLIAYLKQAVAERRRGVNLFLHGMPGTGKTELTRVIGKALGVPVYEVETSGGDGAASRPAERLRGLDLANTTLSSRPCLLVFDEAEDVFSATLFERSVASTHKGWFNSMLEQNRWPVIWVSNQIHGLDPAFVRRFDMVLEVPVPPRVERQRLIASVVGDLVGDELGERIAASKNIAPAVLARAANVIRKAGGGMSISKREAAISRLLGDTLKAQGHPDPFQGGCPTAGCGSYDPTLLNTSCDLAGIARQLRSVGEARVCLHGPPGTGKTAFGHWLAAELDRPLLAKKASDLLGKYVGETEERISEAFEEATRDNAILLLDEVDSFLVNREGAQRNWEITSVNEMLTQIESFPGLLIATTNRLEALDPASLRRFDLKVGFDYLRGDQVEAMLVAQSLHFGFSGPDRETLSRAASLTTCTPGDFAAVARRHRFDPFDSARELLAAVCDEIRHRTPIRHPIGFA